MISPANGGTGNLKALLDYKIDTPVGNDDVATLRKGGDYARYCREPLGVQNRGLCSEEVWFGSGSRRTCASHLPLCTELGCSGRFAPAALQWCLAEASANSRTAPGHFYNFATPETRMRRITYLSAAYVVIHLFDIFVQAIMGTTSASPPMELARVAPIRLRLRTLDPKATSHIHGMYAVIRLLVQNIRSVKQRIVISNMRTPQ